MTLKKNKKIRLKLKSYEFLSIDKSFTVKTEGNHLINL